MSYRVMNGDMKYAYIGEDLQAAADAFRSVAGTNATLEEYTHEITKEPFVAASSPEDGELVGTFYGATIKEYENATKNTGR